MNAATVFEIEQALAQWRKRADFVERGEMRYTDRGLYEDYMAAIAALAAVLIRYESVDALLASWEQHTLRLAMERVRILAPGRGVLRADVLEGAAYWRRFTRLVAERAN